MRQGSIGFIFKFVAWISRLQKAMRWFFIILIIYWVSEFYPDQLRSQFGNEGVHWGACPGRDLSGAGFGRSFEIFSMLDPFARHATGKEKAWSCLAAAIYGFFLTLEILDNAWPQVAVLVGIVLFSFGLSSRLVFKLRFLHRSVPQSIDRFCGFPGYLPADGLLSIASSPSDSLCLKFCQFP